MARHAGATPGYTSPTIPCSGPVSIASYAAFAFASPLLTVVSLMRRLAGDPGLHTGSLCFCVSVNCPCPQLQHIQSLAPCSLAKLAPPRRISTEIVDLHAPPLHGALS